MAGKGRAGEVSGESTGIGMAANMIDEAKEEYQKNARPELKAFCENLPVKGFADLCGIHPAAGICSIKMRNY